MSATLYTQPSNASQPDCPVRGSQQMPWWQDLPSPMRELVVAPISFDVLPEYEVSADRTHGYDDHHKPCYCAFRYVQTELRSDDDEVFYEAPVYAETLTSWRLPDARWLVRRTTIGNFDSGECQTRFSVSEAMPR